MTTHRTPLATMPLGQQLRLMGSLRAGPERSVDGDASILDAALDSRAGKIVFATVVIGVYAAVIMGAADRIADAAARLLVAHL